MYIYWAKRSEKAQHGTKVEMERNPPKYVYMHKGVIYHHIAKLSGHRR